MFAGWLTRYIAMADAQSFHLSVAHRILGCQIHKFFDIIDMNNVRQTLLILILCYEISHSKE